MKKKDSVKEDTKPVMVLWRDDSPEYRKLEQLLRDGGYKMRVISTEAAKPTVDYPGNFVFGYKEIKMTFDVRSRIN